MVALADNDVLFKLAALELLGQLPDMLEVAPSSIHVLDSIPYVARKNTNIKDRFGEGAVDRTLEFVDGLPELGAGNVPDWPLDQLNDCEAIDVGEAILFAAATQYDPVCVVTGDKRSLRALCESDCDDIIEEVSGCVVCFEELMLRSIVLVEYEVVRERVIAAPDVDKVLNEIAFRNGENTSKEKAEAALQSYRDGLDEETGLLLTR